MGHGGVSEIGHFVPQSDHGLTQPAGDPPADFNHRPVHLGVANHQSQAHVEIIPSGVGILQFEQGRRGVGVLAVQGELEAVFLAPGSDVARAAGGEQSRRPGGQPVLVAMERLAWRAVAVGSQVGQAVFSVKRLDDVAAPVQSHGESQVRARVHHRHPAPGGAAGIGPVVGGGPDAAHLVNELELAGVELDWRVAVHLVNRNIGEPFAKFFQ